MRVCVSLVQTACCAVCRVHCSVELRELEAMLKAAYVSKAHVTQMAEKAALQTEEKAMDIAAAEVMMEQVRREEEAERQKELQQLLRMRKYQQEVKRQMEVFRRFSHSYSLVSLHVVVVVVS